MIGYQNCRFSGRPAKKLCAHAKCKQPAFTCLVCEDCHQLHDHDGLTTLRNWDTLLPDLDAMRAHKLPTCDPALSQPLKLIARLTELLQTIQKQLNRDFDSAATGLELKPSIGALVEKMYAKNSNVTGGQICELLDAMKKGQTYSNRTSIDKKLGVLNDRYCGFMESIEQMMSAFIDGSDGSPAVRTNNIASSKPELIAKQREVSDHDRQKLEAEKSSRSLLSLHQDSQSIRSNPRPTPEPPANNFERISQYSSGHQQKEPTLRFTYIADIEPGAERINLIAKVMLAQIERHGENTFMKCTIGDKTGMVNCRFYYQEELKKGAVLELLALRAKVYQGHIVLNTMRPNTITLSKEIIKTVNHKLNVSDEKWKEEIH